MNAVRQDVLPQGLREILDGLAAGSPAEKAAGAGLDFVFYNWESVLSDGVDQFGGEEAAYDMLAGTYDAVVPVIRATSGSSDLVHASEVLLEGDVHHVAASDVVVTALKSSADEAGARAVVADACGAIGRVRDESLAHLRAMAAAAAAPASPSVA